MAFNFGNIATAKPTSTTNYLKPYTINENVSIKETEVKSGTTKNGDPWKSLVITLGNDEGIYKHSIFYPNEKNPKDIERQSYDTNNGGKRYTPSAIEELQNQIASFGFEFFPEDFAKLQSIIGKIQTVDQLMEYFKKFMDKNIDKVHTKMKLTGRNNDGRIYATLPKFTGIACADTDKKAENNNVEKGDWYIWRVSPFGEKVAFSAYEQQQADAYRNAKPTSIDKKNTESNLADNFDSVETDDSEDLDSLIAQL